MRNFDVTIIGGGIAGLGVADACSRRGLSTLLLEAGTVGEATSSNTLRIIHGGFRYLQQLNFARVIRSLRDQSRVAHEFSGCVTPLPCLMPLERIGLKSRIPVTAASVFYGAMMRAGGSPLPHPSVLSHAQVQEIAPQLAPLALHGALCWYDLVMLEPKEIHATLANRIRSSMGVILEHEVAKEIRPTNGGFSVTTARGSEFQSHAVVNTLGPWLHTLVDSIPPLSSPPHWCLGFNITIAQQLHPTHALAVQGRDGRLFFSVPRGAHTTIGTWYVPCEPPKPLTEKPQKPLVPESAIAAFITSYNNACGHTVIEPQDITDIDAGILPMKSQGATGPLLYGSEHIELKAGYCEVMSTKYTTFRSQGEYVASKLLRDYFPQKERL